MNILIAPNSFKHSLAADVVATAIEEGLKLSSAQFNCEKFPVGDGGDGTGELIIQRFNGSYIEGRAKDPLGRDITTAFGLIHGSTAVIEMANTSGIRLLKHNELNPLRASSFGTGQQIKQALDYGADKIIIGLGGSATVDGGWGILQALGVVFLNKEGKELQHISPDLFSIDVSGIDERLKRTGITVMCDVKNKLLGDKGAAIMFGPQKGAKKKEVDFLEAALANYAQIVFDTTGVNINIDRCGAAGGAATGLYAFANAKLVDGIDYFLDLTGFKSAVNRADLVITGEGSIDEQTLEGKAPFGVARMAKRKQLKVIALAGKVPGSFSNALAKHFDIIRCINPEGLDLETAIRNTYQNLVNTSKEIGDELLNL